MEYREKAKMLLNLLEEGSILAENEITHEISHVNFLEKTLEKLKTAVGCLRYVRKKKMTSKNKPPSYAGEEKSNYYGFTQKRNSNLKKNYFREAHVKSGNLNIKTHRSGYGNQITPKTFKTDRAIHKLNGARDKEKEVTRHELKSIKSMDRIFTKDYNFFGERNSKSKIFLEESRKITTMRNSGYASKNSNRNVYTSREAWMNSRKGKKSYMAKSVKMGSASLRYLKPPKQGQKHRERIEKKGRRYMTSPGKNIF